MENVGRESSLFDERLEGGEIAGTRGHLRFDLGGRRWAPRLLRCRPDDPAEARFAHAVALEADDRLEEAARAYHEAMIEDGAQAEMTFNLGNVLYRLGRLEAAAERFMQTVEMDPEWVASWNNLGNTLGELGRLDEAVEAFRRALAIDPSYADAHFNLAEVLHAAGRTAEARAHWRAYLAYDATSPWADRVRERLA